MMLRGLLLILMVLPATALAAGDKRDHLGDYRDWSTFRDDYADGSRVCYMTSLPVKMTANKKDAKRGRVFAMISHWPKAGVRDQVRISGGYPYKAGSSVTATIDGKDFILFTKDDDAWARDSATDAAIVKAMKAGQSLVVKGVSGRGTTTRDQFSLNGFTAAYQAISKACG